MKPKSQGNVHGAGAYADMTYPGKKGCRQGVNILNIAVKPLNTKNMKYMGFMALAALSATNFLAPLQAAPPSFDTPTASSTDSDVLNAGGTAGTALAWDFYDAANNSSTTINGVTFSGSQTNATTGVFFAFTGFGASDNNGFFPGTLASSASSDYANFLSGLVYNSGVDGALSFSNLTAGDTYELQIFSGTTGLGSQQSEVLTDQSGSGTTFFDGDGSNSGNYFITETFTASSSPESISVVPPGDGFIILNAVNLRDLSAPEPSTYAMLLGGLAVLGFCVRRKLA